MLAPSVAAGQDRSPTPSAEELWRTYPLERTPEPGVTPAASVRTATASSPRAGDDGAPLPLVGAAALLAALAAGLAVLRIRSRPPALARPRWAAPLLPAAAAAAMLPGQRPRSQRITALAEGPPPSSGDAPDDGLRPPDPRQAWTAEVEWDDSCFAVVARADDGRTGIRLATSARLPWPPSDAKAVRDLTRAAEHLEASLLAAGWTPLAPGAAWYAKRFAWAGTPQRTAPAPIRPEPALEPVAPLPRTDAVPPTRRFARDTEWPAGSKTLWRCEIKWRAGYVNSRFDAVAHAPKRLRRTNLGHSEVFKWLLKGEPEADDADYVKQVRRLADRLVAAGWEPAGRGRHWYELRFVWRREDAAPKQLDPVHAEAGQ